MSSLHIRHARETESHTIAQLLITAFRGRAMNDAIFPEHLRGDTGASEELELRAGNLARSIGNNNHHHIVVADDADEVVGYAEWVDGEDPVVDMTPEERKKKRAERIEKLPKSLDLEAFDRAMAELVPLFDMLKGALGKEGYNNSWSLNAIAVDPVHQRKGIGKMLTGWGLKRAEKEQKNIHFLSSPSGAKLYRAMGFEEVGSKEILGGMEYAFIKRAGV
ncbi:hypothetical protein VM1G_04737 [Cytospora mali]|uniref:N-acetyltransferase domain-containing protein n=1 Tax=Cytospora mali TaxID=578113 RepID=A0A194W0M9_CYTMA|nr:hypothetical protein VM1G_04737 [Valsa mali]